MWAFLHAISVFPFKNNEDAVDCYWSGFFWGLSAMPLWSLFGKSQISDFMLKLLSWVGVAPNILDGLSAGLTRCIKADASL